MAYLDRTTDPRRRTAAVGGVIVIHALLAYVLITGLAQHFVRHAPTPPLKGTNFPLPPPPPPPLSPKPQPKKAPEAQGPAAPHPELPLPNPGPIVPPFDPGPIPSDGLPTGVPTTAPSPPPTPTLAFKPKPPVPLTNPRNWIGTDDYPSRDIREENEGTTAFRVVVGTNGRVSACEIVRSSGHPGLDAATCKLVSARARFRAATDENGESVVGTYGNSVRWQLPR